MEYELFHVVKQDMRQMNKQEFINYGTCYNVGIFYKDNNWASEIYDIIFRKVNAAVRNSRKAHGIMDIILYGGIRYQFVKAGDSARGHKFNKVFIQEGISQDIINNVIMPCLYEDGMVMLE